MSELLTTVAILFIIAGPFLLLADRLDLPAVPLLILSGIFAGTVFIQQDDLLVELAQYGIALLVFAFGVGIQLDAIRTVLADSEIAALGQILVIGSLGTAFGVALGVPLAEASVLGVAAALSSTMVGTALVRTEIRMNLVRGRLSESLHFVQDLFAIAVVLIVGAGVIAADPIATQLGYGVVLLAAAVAVNRYLFGLLGRLADGSDELMIVGVVSLLVVFIGVAELAGVSIVVGAFAAGIAVRHDRGEHLGLFTGLESIKDFFLAIFFVTVGALVAVPFLETGPAASVEKLLLATGLIVLVVLIKPAVTIAILMYKGYEARTATLTAITTDQVSEFSLIIAIEAFLIGILTQSVFDAIIFAAAVTMVISSLTQRHDEAIYRLLSSRGLVSTRHDKIDELSNVPDDITDHVVIVGYGRTGSHLVETCKTLEKPYVVIENDPTRREAVRVECDAHVFGDAMEEYTWEKAGVERADIVISTTPYDPVSWRLLAFEFEADLILRSPTQQTALELLEAGATYVVVSDLLAGEQLLRRIEALLEGESTAEQLRDERLEELDRRSVTENR